jgi:hypothetical protein
VVGILVAALVALAAAAITVVAARRGDDTASPPGTTAVVTTDAPITSSGTTAAPTSTALPTAPPTTPPPLTAAPTTAPEPGSPYIGMTHAPSAPPNGIRVVSSSVIGTGAYVVNWVEGPEGSMFWLERVTLGDATDLQQLEVTDVVIFPPLEQDVGDIVITGQAPCQLDGTPVQGVVGIFPYNGQQWLTDPYAVWWVDEVAGTFVELPPRTTCIDEGFGA